MRLFIAINVSDNTRDRLLALRDELRGRSSHGNFTRPENLHLTLAFLGECNDTQAASARYAIDEVDFEPFYMRFERIGLFRRPRGNLWWAGAKESGRLIYIQRQLMELLIEVGFAFDKQKYSPHITIARDVVADESVRPWPIEPFGEFVERMDLMKSERIGGKLTYTAI
jgi:2'-5' RNA ligase